MNDHKKFLFNQYIDFHNTYTEKYGPDTVVLLQNGSHFNLFAIINDELNLGPDIYHIGNNILNITVTKQNKKIPKSENIPEGWIKGRVVNWEKTKELKIAEVRTCPCCEKEFEVLEGSPKVYCSGKCRAKVNGKKYRSRKRVEPKKKRVVKTLLQKEVRYCECCGKEFECWESSHKKYCSSSCKNKSSYNSIEKIKISRNGENKIIKPQNYNAYKKIGWKKI